MKTNTPQTKAQDKQNTIVKKEERKVKQNNQYLTFELLKQN